VKLGADLFDKDKFNYQYTDTVSILAQSEMSESLVGYSNTIAPTNTLFVGNMEDPIFGITETRAYTQLAPDATSVGSGFIVDSVIFRLFYNSTGTYGDTTKSQRISVYRLTETLVGNLITTDKTFKTEAQPLASIQFKPTPNVTVRDSVRLTVNGVTKDTIGDFRPRLSFRLPNTFGEQILSDTNRNTDLGKFYEWFKGLEVRAEGMTSAITAFSFRAADSTGIYIHYKTSTTDTVRRVFRVSTTDRLVRYTHFRHDYSKSKVLSYLKNPAKTDTVLFVQSGGGILTKLEFPHLKNLGSIAVNKAVLEFTINTEEADTLLFRPIRRFLLAKTNFDAIDDANASTGSLRFFGGDLTKNGSTSVYRMNITAHLQRMLDGRDGNNIYLIPELQVEEYARSILYGGKSPQFKAKLLLSYTKLAN
jgi:hypothetical protein